MPLQDSDNFIIGRGTDSYKITYEDLKDDLNYVPPPVKGRLINLPLLNLMMVQVVVTHVIWSDAISSEIEGGGIDPAKLI